ncbi:MAG: thioredoxin [Betaproteobacteria bacterium]|nr:thioredoxin [Betaproteobacteria bacterium]
MGSFTKDVTDETFESDVIEASKKVPVLVDFWAPWCGPCRSLAPVLEQLADQYEGKFLLAKVNSDENPGVSRQYAIRSIPNVKAFIGGQQTDEFLGALPESQVRHFIERLLPSPAQILRQEAAQARAEGDNERALKILSQAALLDPRNDEIIADQAQVLLDMGESDQAQAAIKRLSPLASHNSWINTLIAKVQFAANTTAEEDTESLRARVAANPADLESRFNLANQLVMKQEFEPALDHLLEIVQRDRNFRDDIGRKTMLSLFSLITDRGDLVRRYRQALAAAIH